MVPPPRKISRSYGRYRTQAVKVPGLVLTFRPGEKVMLGDDIVVEVARVVGEKVRLRIHAPRSLPVYREKIWRIRHGQVPS
ncbi:hypothetical protein DP939_01130 [Spongiactinospora rosea]|uniref:Translational regulator CsrA n=1 Tax=Spongiactinospora rosea TaxID=2248750 RepID=A0A366M7B5_9ACTN|nr:carbon storage regulator [Spongiactinospora rosea]RBQ21352.1 hypothetical protein DP939_01130 [Spongiactinospora rosea]